MNWRPPSLTSGKVLWEKGAPRKNAGLSTARLNRPTATESRPRQPFHLRPETLGRLGRFKAEPRLPEASGARSPPSRGPAAPHRAKSRRPGPPRARAGAWPGTRPRPERGARTSSRQRNYRASPCDRIEFISGDYLATPPVQLQAASYARAPASAHAQCGASARASELERNTGHHRRTRLGRAPRGSGLAPGARLRGRG